MPYLAGQDDYGNTAIRPGALFNFVPLDGPVQGGKYWLSQYGFRYSLQQTFTLVNMTGVKQGDSDLEYYTLDLKAKWSVYNAPDSGTAGWISSQVENKNGFNSASSTQSAKSNLGTVTDPTGILVIREWFPNTGTGLATVLAPRRNRRGSGDGWPE